MVTFKSKGAGDVQMFAEHAAQILQIVGKTLEPPGAPRGIIPAAQVADALARLRAAVAQARGESRDDSDAEPPRVGLAQRAFPFIELLERAARDGNDVVWGV